MGGVIFGSGRPAYDLAPGLPAGGTAGDVLIRIGTGQYDAEWKKLVAADVSALPAQIDQTSGTANLNDYTTPGLYYFSSGVTLANVPHGAVNGWLWVLEASNGDIKQIWIRHGSNPNTFKDLYVRLYSSSAWGNWSKIYTDADYYSTHSNVYGVAVATSASELHFIVPWISPTGSAPASGKVTGLSVTISGITSPSVSYDTSRSNGQCLCFTITKSNSFTNHYAYFGYVSFTISP